MGVFATLSALRTWLGITVSTALFALILAVVMVVLKYFVDYKKKEDFRFEVSENIPQCEHGFSGRPLNFEYSIPDCNQCGNDN